MYGFYAQKYVSCQSSLVYVHNLKCKNLKANFIIAVRSRRSVFCIVNFSFGNQNTKANIWKWRKMRRLMTERETERPIEWQTNIFTSESTQIKSIHVVCLLCIAMIEHTFNLSYTISTCSFSVSSSSSPFSGCSFLVLVEKPQAHVGLTSTLHRPFYTVHAAIGNCISFRIESDRNEINGHWKMKRMNSHRTAGLFTLKNK